MVQFSQSENLTLCEEVAYLRILLVPSGGINPDGTLGRSTITRLEYALEHQNEFDRILCSGGITNPNQKTLACIEMRKWLLENGLPESKLILRNSTAVDSWSNIFDLWYSLCIIKEKTDAEVSIVSYLQHLKRFRIICRYLFRNVHFCADSYKPTFTERVREFIQFIITLHDPHGTSKTARGGKRKRLQIQAQVLAQLAQKQ